MRYTWLYKYPISKIFVLPFNSAFYKLVSCHCCKKFPQTLRLKNICSLTALAVRSSTSVLLGQQNHTSLGGSRLRIGYLPLPAFGGYQPSWDLGYSTPGTFAVDTLSPPPLRLLPLPPYYKGSYDYTGLTQIIQNNFTISRSLTLLHLQSIFRQMQ